MFKKSFVVCNFQVPWMPRDTSHCTALLNLHCLDVGSREYVCLWPHC